MAANDSPTSIWNTALLMLGEDPVQNISPPSPNVKRAIVGQQLYDVSRRAILAAACWKCAKRRSGPLAQTTAPDFYPYAYKLPADFIRLWKPRWHDPEPYDTMNIQGVGSCIVTHHGPTLDLDYIFDLQDCTQMEPLLVMALAADLAAVAAIALARDLGLKNTAEQEREGRLSVARSVSAQQATPPQWDDDVLLRSRA